MDVALQCRLITHVFANRASSSSTPPIQKQARTRLSKTLLSSIGAAYVSKYESKLCIIFASGYGTEALVVSGVKPMVFISVFMPSLINAYQL